jgi:hypothetical protein
MKSVWPICTLLICLFVACEGPGVRFTDPQPTGTEPCTSLPDHFLGTYYKDFKKLVSLEPDEALMTIKDSMEAMVPMLRIEKDTLRVMDYDVKWVHQDSLDGDRYMLMNGHLLRDGKRPGDFPYQKRDSLFYYIELDKVTAVPVWSDAFEDNQDLLSLRTCLMEKTNGFVVNFSKGEHWIGLLFLFTNGNRNLAIRFPKFFSQLGKADFKGISVKPIGEEYYLARTKNENQFSSITEKTYQDFLFLEKR